MPAEQSFESMYAKAGTDFAALPWAALAPNSLLTGWLDELSAFTPVPTGRALVVGCGLGDDAEELSRRGLAVTAFDVSQTAIQRCRQRFPESAVDYLVADVFEPAAEWSGAFDVIVEIRTLQSLPPGTREAASHAIAGLLAPGGRLLVICLARHGDHPVDARPWPVSRGELSAFTRAGLTQVSLDELAVGDGGRPTFVVQYTRSEWEERLARLWASVDGRPEAEILAAVDALTSELSPQSPIRAFERAAARDSTGHSDEAVPLYRQALADGLTGIRRRRAVIQLASSLRNLGQASESIALLTAELKAPSDELDDAVAGFLALALADVGREREAASLALQALAPHLPRYQRSLRNYAASLTEEPG
jgi:SAM-dependent methyltransferase